MTHCWDGKEVSVDPGDYCEFCDGPAPSDPKKDYAGLHWHSGTCLLQEGHEGPHQFVPDDQIEISFKGSDE
jgi:hypothetical protein